MKEITKQLRTTLTIAILILAISAISMMETAVTASNANDGGADNLSPTVCVAQPPNLVSWYKGENNALDSADGNNGTIQGDVTYTTGKVGQTFTLGGNGDLNGNGDRVIVGNPANLRLQNFTIEAWIKRSSSTIVTNSPFSGFDNGVFFAYGQSGYGFFIDRATNRLGLTHINVSNVTSNATVTDTNFHHVAVTKSGNQVTFYVDGVASAPVTYNPTFTFATNAAIGARGDDNAKNAFFGSIDELSIYNRALSLAEIQGIFNAGSGGKCDLPTPTAFDFDGDGKTDISVFRPSEGQYFYLRSSDGVDRGFPFGSGTDKPVPADFTGDGKTDIAFWRPSTGQWFVLRSEDNSFFAFPFGSNGDIPAPGDFDGDGKADAAVFRPSNATWFIRNSSDGSTTIRQFGLNGDVPIVEDYDGDGKADLAVYRPSASEWYLQRSTSGFIGFRFGAVGDTKPVPADFTGDGKADIAFFAPSTGRWFVLRSEDTSFFAFPFGTSTDIPAPGDYDGDGKADAVVYRQSTGLWYLNQTTSGQRIVPFGAANDKPLPAAFLP